MDGGGPAAQRVLVQALGLGPAEDFQVYDLLGGAWYSWHGARNYVELDPDVFGSELADSAYGEVERLAAVGLVAVLPW